MKITRSLQGRTDSFSGNSGPLIWGESMGNCPLPCFSSDQYLVGGAITILKNDGVRQWEEWKSMEIPYID